MLILALFTLGKDVFGVGLWSYLLKEIDFFFNLHTQI